MMTATSALRDALRDACEHVGIVYRDVPADGRWHATDVQGDPRGRGDGRIKLFADGEGGIVINWKGDAMPFFAENSHALTDAARRERERRRAEALRIAAAEDAERRAEAAARALALWKAAQPAAVNHPYLSSKKVSPVSTLREINADKAHAILKYPPQSQGELLTGRLLIAPVKIQDKLSTIELIDETGRKSALFGGAKAEGYWATDRLPDGDGAGLTLLIGEGIATVLSAREAMGSGHIGIAALSCNNLLLVAQAIRQRYPQARVIVLSDTGPGERHAVDAARAAGVLLALPDFGTDRPEWATDVNDLAVLKGVAAVRSTIAAASKPAAVVTAETPEPPWPALDPAALYGLAGDIVRAIEPHTEADPAAILIQLLAGFGNVAGRHAYYQVEADHHYPNLYCVLVGVTSKARKGTSWGQILALLKSVDPDWAANCIKSGLSSGEGLIEAVRDPIAKTERGQTVVADGVEDKRLLVVETEFAAVLKVLGREGNNLSAIVRNAWDRGDLRTLTKNAPGKATGAHISVIGHTVADELRRYLTATEAGNGFANRFLWFSVKRSKHLPRGGNIGSVDFSAIVRRLTEAAASARRADRLDFDPDAGRAWDRVYGDLSEGHSGLLGAVTSRAEAQVVRLALLYAVLDCSATIRSEHLFAALAVWEYAEASARHIFGDSTGDPVADQILTALRGNPDGLSRTQISALFNRNKDAEQIGRALAILFKERRAHTEKAGNAEIWKASGGTKSTKSTKS